YKHVKIHFKPDAGIKTLDSSEALRLAGEEPDHHIKDLYNAIDCGDYPSWTMYFQIMHPKEAETYRWNIFDITRIWPHKDYPLRPVGRLVLNRNPDNHFQDVEQAAFSPSNMVPGIGPSVDPMLQARMFSYPGAARYRIGPNYQQLPCNRASYVYSPFQRDGPMRVDGNYGGGPDYSDHTQWVPLPVLRLGPKDVTHDEWVGKGTLYSTGVTKEDFEQPRDLWSIFKSNGKDKAFACNVAAHLGKALPGVQKATIEMFSLVYKEVGEAIGSALKELEGSGGAGIEHCSQPRQHKGYREAGKSYWWIGPEWRCTHRVSATGFPLAVLPVCGAAFGHAGCTALTAIYGQRLPLSQVV
ncbi:catalase-like domain-containing protein, partial [Parachaetomium inaequale]